MPKAKKDTGDGNHHDADPEIMSGVKTGEIRQRLGLSVQDFASALKVRDYTVERWERGESKPSPMARELIRMLLSSKAKVRK